VNVGVEQEIRGYDHAVENDIVRLICSCSNAGILIGAGMECRSEDWAAHRDINVMAHNLGGPSSGGRALTVTLGGGYLLNTASAAASA